MYSIYHVAMSHLIMDRGKPVMEQVETILKLINNSTREEGNHNHDGVWISDLSINFMIYFLCFLVKFISIEKILKHLRQCLTTFPNTSRSLFLMFEMW